MPSNDIEKTDTCNNCYQPIYFNKRTKEWYHISTRAGISPRVCFWLAEPVQHDEGWSGVFITKAEADYTASGSGMRRCWNCAMYRERNKCTLVEGYINRKGWCKYHSLLKGFWEKRRNGQA